MPDASDPPRKIYGLKASPEFERVNPPIDAPSAGPTDIEGMIESATRKNLATKGNVPSHQPNDVHALLQLNQRHDVAAGLHEVSTAPDPRRIKRRRAFWTAIILIDGLLGFLAWRVGHEVPIVFVCAIGAMAMFTGVLVWRTWCFRTEA